jgi:hypothetical protein
MPLSWHVGLVLVSSILFFDVCGEGAFGFALLCTRRFGVLFLMVVGSVRDLTRKPPDAMERRRRGKKTALPELSARG